MEKVIGLNFDEIKKICIDEGIVSGKVIKAEEFQNAIARAVTENNKKILDELSKEVKTIRLVAKEIAEE